MTNYISESDPSTSVDVVSEKTSHGLISPRGKVDSSEDHLYTTIRRSPPDPPRPPPPSENRDSAGQFHNIKI